VQTQSAISARGPYAGRGQSAEKRAAKVHQRVLGAHAG